MTISACRLGVLMFACILVGCATAHEPALPASVCGARFTPSELLASGGDCDGQRVVVQGLLRVGSEMRGLWDTQDDIESGNFMKACITVYNPRGLKIDGPVRWVDVTGIYRAQRPPRLVILGACTDEILEIETIDERVHGGPQSRKGETDQRGQSH